MQSKCCNVRLPNYPWKKLHLSLSEPSDFDVERPDSGSPFASSQLPPTLSKLRLSSLGSIILVTIIIFPASVPIIHFRVHELGVTPVIHLSHLCFSIPSNEQHSFQARVDNRFLKTSIVPGLLAHRRILLESTMSPAN